MRLLPKLPLLLRGTIAVVAVGLLPLAVAWWMLTGVNRDGMTVQVLRTHAVAASTAARRIDALLEARLASTRSIANANVDLSSETGQELLRSLLQSDAGLAAIAAIEPSGQERIRVQRKEHAADVTALLGRAGDREIALERSGDRLWLITSAPSADGGVVRVIADGAPLGATLQAKELGQEAEIAVVAGGRLLFGAADLRDFPAEMLTVAAKTPVDGSGVFGQGRDSVVGAYAGVGGTGWVVLSRQPAAVARAVEAEMRRGSLSAAGVALGLAALFIGLAWVSVVRPLKRVAEAQRKLVGSGVASGDEIEQLRNGVAVLERRKSDQEDLGRVFLGRYHVLDLLGEGGMGTVFRGWDPRLQRPVALKTIRFGIAGDDAAERESMVAMLVREAVTIARFNHPHIVSVYDVEETPQGAYLAMELIDGVNLQRYLRTIGFASSADATLLGLAIAEALATAHRQGVVHRDIKPPNVLLGREGAIKVSDFGLADLVSTLHGLGKGSFVNGTPGYIAPECVTGGAATASADLFSLGVLLYECVTARNPFEAETVATMFQATLHLDPPPPNFYNPRVHPELEAIIVKLMQKRPEDRFRSAEDVAVELRRLAAAQFAQWTFNDLALTPGANAMATLRVAV